MERKIGEIFKYNDVTLEVVKANPGCEGCYFRQRLCGESIHITGYCCGRKDKTSVIFKEVKNNMKEEVKEIILPEGFVVDKIEDGRIILKSENKLDSWKECVEYLKNKESLEFIDNTSNIIGIKEIGVLGSKSDRNILPRGYGEALLALSQLLICRNAWWERLNWVPNWKSESQEKYCIVNWRNEVSKTSTGFMNYILAFPTPETRDEFLDTFKNLIEQAKDLI